jgi:hypothetical protein
MNLSLLDPKLIALVAAVIVIIAVLREVIGKWVIDSGLEVGDRAAY